MLEGGERNSSYFFALEKNEMERENLSQLLLLM